VKPEIEAILPLVRKPQRYIGNELNSIHKDWDSVKIHIAIAYPDLYELGMSSLGLQILYYILNADNRVVAERVFSPAQDMEDKLKENNLSLFSLESQTPISKFDMVGFSLGHELTYTNLLGILELSNIPLYSKDRKENDPLIFAGGPGAYNTAPIEEFIDFIVIGEAEELLGEIVDCILNSEHGTPNTEHRNEILKKLAQIEGIYVPSIGNKTKKRYVKDFNNAPYPTKPIVPFIEAVHDRAVVEIMRGCPRMCKFCSACQHYWPVRMKKPEKVIELATEILKNTGYDEITLISLSSSDYTYIEQVAKEISIEAAKKKINVSLPSLRLDSFSINLAKDILRVRPTSVTLAPEAGTQRLRDVIGKDLTEEDILTGAEAAFSEGVTSLKLYFMIGLPTETEEDIQGIPVLINKIANIGRKYTSRFRVTASASTFVPKPHTEFERVRQISIEEILAKQSYLRNAVRGKGTEIKCHDPKMSILEGILSRGDKRLAKAILSAYKMGAKFDAWTEHFKFDVWLKALEENNLTVDDYLRERSIDEELPWSKILLR